VSYVCARYGCGCEKKARSLRIHNMVVHMTYHVDPDVMVVHMTFVDQKVKFAELKAMVLRYNHNSMQEQEE
jgi:hypothetical protein